MGPQNRAKVPAPLQTHHQHRFQLLRSCLLLCHLQVKVSEKAKLVQEVALVPTLALSHP